MAAAATGVASCDTVAADVAVAVVADAAAAAVVGTVIAAAGRADGTGAAGAEP